MDRFEFTNYLRITDSSVLDAAWYDSETKVLVVRFSRTQGLAAYCDVPPEVYAALVNANSRGSYYSSDIKPEFYGLSVDQDCFMVRRPSNVTVAPALSKAQRTFEIKVLREEIVEIAANSLEDAVAILAKTEGVQKIVSATVTF